MGGDRKVSRRLVRRLAIGALACATSARVLLFLIEFLLTAIGFVAEYRYERLARYVYEGLDTITRTKPIEESP